MLIGFFRFPVLGKGQASSQYYRFLTKNGGWTWIQSYMTIVHNSRSSRPHCIVSVNYVISERLEPDIITNAEQIQQLSRSFPSTSNTSSNSSWLDFGTESTSTSPRSSRGRRSQINPTQTPHHYSPEPATVVYESDHPIVQHDQRLMPSLTAFEYQADYQLTDVSGSPNWYPSVVPTPRVEYQDSPIQWHTNPMYSGNIFSKKKNRISGKN